MRTRRLGKTDLELTVIGLGTWAIGGGDWKFGWGPQDDRQAVAAIHHGIEMGVNWIDTAPVYGNGRSEELVGRALAGWRGQRPLVATKCGRIISGDGEIEGVLQAESVQAECEASLRRLGVEAIDLYQIHWPDPDTDIAEAWQAMVDLQAQGKVRQLGVSNFALSQMQRLQTIHEIASLQPPYSMLAREAEAELLPYCADQGIGVVAYSPMGKGLLTGKFDPQRAAALPASDHRSRDPKFAEPQLGINLLLVERLRKVAGRHGRSVAELALAWVLRRDEVTSAIVGARNPEQIAATAKAADWMLADEDLRDIERLLAERNAALADLGPLDKGRV
jgi:aryl-alcohol dehydrogenase-like predicted oxidoreductase